VDARAISAFTRVFLRAMRGHDERESDPIYRHTLLSAPHVLDTPASKGPLKRTFGACLDN